MYNNTLLKKALSLLVCLALVLSCLPSGILKVSAAGEPLNIVADSKQADPSTLNGWETYFGPQKMDTEFAGAVWTDKSVFTAATDDLPGVALVNPNNFLVSLSAIASTLSITGHTSSPTDTMLVLDMSGSMVDGTYEVGTIRWGNNSYQTVDGIDMSLIAAMIEATNSTIDELMKQNANNRVGVVLYSGNTSSNQDATPGTATVVLPLGRYTGIDGEYLSLDTTWTTSTLYSRRNGRWQASGEATYVAEGTNVSVSVKNGLKTEAGGNVTDRSKQAVGGTYIQNGLYQAMNQFLAVTDTIVPEGRPQAGAERMPVLVLMSDGAPTIATTDYTEIGNSDTGDGTATNDRITFLTQLTAAYVRGRVAAKYQENANDEKNILFLTLGLGTENSTAATNTLYPAGSNSTLTGYWNTYLRTNAGSTATIISGNNGLRLTRNANVAAMNYVDKYFYASNAQGLIDSFKEIVGEIELKAGSYATLVEGSSADFSGYVTFEDELGELMHVSDMKGVLMSDGNGGTVLYTGKGIAESLTSGNLGTVDNPTDRGDELIRTVRERIPGTTTTQAQQLVNNAYLDQQLYFTDDNNWSNYIGWYADENGNYVGFWDKDSGYENAPAGAVYANRSYGYLGVNGDSDMMHVVVMVRTELATLHQTVYFKVPASLLPTVQYKVTLKENDPNQVDKFQREDAIPMRLVFEVGLREDINSVNLEQKIAEHIQKGGHVHRNNDGTVTFYTNEWAINGTNDKNGNGIPDPEEVDTALVAESHFHPAFDNNRFYYTEDTVILSGNDNPVTGSTRPSDTDNDPDNGTGYHYDRYIYDANGRRVIHTPIAATTLQNDAKYDTANNRWYVPAGTMYHDLARFQINKDPNLTKTLPYAFYPAAFDIGTKQDIYTFLGNNGSFTVAPATGITLRKELESTISGVSRYTFEVTLSNIPSGATAAPLLTDANGDPLSGVTMSEYENNRFTVTMPADVTAYISGIPVGTTVQIAEQIDGDYVVSKLLVAGREQPVDAPASTPIPTYTAGGSQMVPVVFTNAPNHYGNLVITKDVTHSLASDPEALASKIFTFQVTLTGNAINAGDTFATSAGTDVTVAADGTLAFADGSPITLHNEESITVYRIPVGTAYAVEETDIPEGFSLTDSTDASGQITANQVSTAGFVNTYNDEFVPVELPLNVTVNKVLNDPHNSYNGNEQFVFVLQRLLSDNTYPSIKDVNGKEYLTVAANADGASSWNLRFTDIGTYFFQIVELKPSQQVPAGTDTAGMTYSTMRALFEVVISDDDMDGKLELSVREEANIEANATYTDSSDPETASQIDVEATFTNTYEVHSTSVNVDVHKKLNNTTGISIPLTSFQFGLYEVDTEGNATGDPISTVTTSALGDATFNLLITEDADLQYLIKEIVPNPRKAGMTYDPAEYILDITVDVDPESSNLIATPVLTLKGGDPVTRAEFENTFALNPAGVNIPISKTFTGRQLQSGESFQGYLVRTGSTFVPLTDENAWNATYTLPVNSSANVALTLTKAGTYHYKFTEIIPDSATLDPVTGKYVLGGIEYDSSEYHITITVSDNDSGSLTAQTVIHKLGQSAPVSSVSFTNIYTVSGSGEATIGGRKNLTGRALTAGEFAIGLYSDAACQDLLATANNRANGTFSFPTISYTVEDLGENNAPKTYTYYVKEIVPSEAVLNENTGRYELDGVSYDSTVHTVTVTVSHENGILTVTPSQNAASLLVENTYTAKGVEVVLNGSKVLSGDWTKALTHGNEFTFHLYEADASFALTSQTPISPVSVSGQLADFQNGLPFTITLRYADGQEGFHYYVLKEDTSAQAAGVGYDAGEYHITVNVSDPGNGQLVAIPTMYRPGTGNTDTAIFTNAYSVEPTSITLEGTKSYVNAATDQPIRMEEGMFSFLVLEGEDLVATGSNLADGTIQFTPIRYTAAGEHTYSVVEVKGDLGGVSYDETAFTIKVSVEDDGKGKLTATLDAENPAVAFKNTYSTQSAQVTFNGEKFLSGNWNSISAADKTFTFEMYQTDSAFTVNGEPVDSVNAEAGKFTFGTQTYGVEGTHHYVVLEKSGPSGNGIAYDSTRYHITVEVKDNGSGKLVPTVTVSQGNATVTADAENSSHATVDKLNFTNVCKTIVTPQTGDSMNLALWAGLMLFSVIGLLVLILSRKRLVG